MPLSDALVYHVADLARIRIEEAEVSSIARDLGRVLEYVNRLEEVDTTEVEPTLHGGGQVANLRPDTPAPSLARESVLANAPAVRDGMFLIPKILGEGDEA